MPDKPNYPKRTHPINLLDRSANATDPHHPRRRRSRYAELRCHTNFSFLRGASHPEELARQAAKLGYSAIAVTDRNTLAGVVRMHFAAKACNLDLIVGAEITPVDAPPLTLYATDRASYGRLCRIITQGRLRSVKGACNVTLDDITEWNKGLIAAVHGDAPPALHSAPRAAGFNPRGDTQADQAPRPLRAPRRLKPAAQDSIHAYRDIFGDRLYWTASAHDGPDDNRHLAQVAALARNYAIPLVATNDVYYHEPERRFLQDVLTCIRERCTLQEAGKKLFPNAERHLKPIHELQRLFADYPDALAKTIEIADRCRFSLDELRYEYPEALCSPDRSPAEYLAELTWNGAEERYPDGPPHKVRRLLEHELKLIGQLAYEPYFLTVWDIVKFARSRNILCQGRGSAANSAVCYVLGITSVDPDRAELLFERFVSAERNEPPDIDVDFEHERREEVFQYIYNKYGRDHAGIVAEVITYRPRSAIRDVGKALGLSLDHVDTLAKKHEWWDKNVLPEDFVKETGLDPSDRTLRMLRKLVKQLVGFPRHLSQHVGGFVITRGPLCEMVPIENAAMPDRTFIEWDKDDIDALGILKIDCLALGMLTAIHKCFVMIEEWQERQFSTIATKVRATEEGTRTSDEATKLSKGESHAGENIPGSDCLAESDGVGQGGLSVHHRTTRHRAVRTDRADASSRGLDSVEHSGGTWAREPDGLPPLSANRPRLADGTPNTTHPHQRNEPNPPAGRTGEPTRRNGSRIAGPHPKSRSTQQEITSTPPDSPPSLRRSVAPSLSLNSIPPEDPAVYNMICDADTVGVFQIESRAQMSMLPRLKPRCYYDLVIEVAIVRPGPIQGGMVHPYLRRRNGEEPVTYPNEAIKEALKRTLGVPLFQEQAMRLAVVAAGFTPGEADQLRRAMGAWRHNGDITQFRSKLIRGMKANGLSEEFAQRCFEQISGFGEYGFPESHAASFALLVYASAWLKRYHPAAFCASILNSLPMGFYQPAQLVRDAIEHGVTVLPVDVNHSGYDCRLEEATKRRSDGATKDKSGSNMQATNVNTPQNTTRSSSSFTPHHSSFPNPQSPIGNPQSTEENPASRSHPSSFILHPCLPSADPSTWGLGGPAVRLGMRLVRGISRAQVEGIERAQRERPFTSVAELARRSGASYATLARLAAADAMQSLTSPPPPEPRTSARAHSHDAGPLPTNPPRADKTSPPPPEPRASARADSHDAGSLPTNPPRADKTSPPPRGGPRGGETLAQKPDVTPPPLLASSIRYPFSGRRRGDHHTETNRTPALDRRHALWQVLALGDDPPMFEGHEPIETEVELPEQSLSQTVVADYETMGLSLNAHPISLLRVNLNALNVHPAEALKRAKQGQWMKVAGLVLVRQRPGTAKGIVFCTMEDETGPANLIIRPNIYEKYRSTAYGAAALIAEGRIEREGKVVHLQVYRLQNLSTALAKLPHMSRDFR